MAEASGEAETAASGVVETAAAVGFEVAADPAVAAVSVLVTKALLLKLLVSLSQSFLVLLTLKESIYQN